jgi:hypothetical protein
MSLLLLSAMSRREPTLSRVPLTKTQPTVCNRGGGQVLHAIVPSPTSKSILSTYSNKIKAFRIRQNGANSFPIDVCSDGAIV